MEATQVNPEGQTTGITPEALPTQKVVTFEDMRGIERTPHPDAIECYASPEIQSAVGEHFLEVDQKLEQIVSDITELEAINPEEYSCEFAPLSDQLLSSVLTKAQEQLPALTAIRGVREDYSITTGRIFKKTEQAVRYVDKSMPVEGYITSAASKRNKERWQRIAYTAETKAENIRPEAIKSLGDQAAAAIADLLCSDEPETFDPAGKKLPLLATKIRDAGIKPEEVSNLSWDEVVALVPEVSAWIADIQSLQKTLTHKEIASKASKISTRIKEVSPSSFRAIASIYYDEEMLTKLAGLETRVREIQQRSWKTIGLQGDYLATPPKEQGDKFLHEQHDTIQRYFENASRADTLLVHGTGYIPRIIESGSLKPTAAMDDDEFTFNTSRTNIPGARSVATARGSMAVHWAGIRSNAYYARNARYTEEQFRLDISQKLGVRPDHSWVDMEKQKGGFGHAMVVMRYGDILKQTPYGGSRESSFGSDPSNDQPKPRLGEVEITPDGWDKWLANEGSYPRSMEKSSDSAFLAAPQHHPNEEIFDYSYPIESCLIGIPAADPDTIPALLRAKGWTDEQIATQTFLYDHHSGEGQEIQEAVEARSKQPRTLITSIRYDS